MQIRALQLFARRRPALGTEKNPVVLPPHIQFVDSRCRPVEARSHLHHRDRSDYLVDLNDTEKTLDGSAHGVVQPDFIWPSFVIAGFAEEGPIPIPTPVKVFRFDPARAFIRVPSSCLSPQTREDHEINASACAFAHHVPMIVRPTTNLWVELIDQIGGRPAMRSLDGSSDVLQEGFDILLGRLNEQFPVGISAHVLSEEIKAVLHMRHDGLLRREFETSFLQKMLDEGLGCPYRDRQQSGSNPRRSAPLHLRAQIQESS
jgi:hypothetical protein